MSKLVYPSKHLQEETFNEKLLYENKTAWQNLRGFVPKNALAYNERLNQKLALPVYNYADNKFLGYQLRTFLVSPKDFDNRYSLSKNFNGFLFKPDSDDLSNQYPIVLESLYEASLLRLYGINAVATLGVKTWRLNKVNEFFESDNFFVIGDNDRSGQFFESRLSGIPITIDPMYKDLNDFLKSANSACPEEFLDFINFVKQLTIKN